MNCLEFRRAAFADPRTVRAEMEEHARGCPDCAALLQQQRRLSQELRSVMRVTPSANLADRVIFAHAVRPTAAGRRRALAAAAATIAALALALFVHQPVSLASQIARHIEEERLERDPVDRQAPAEFPKLVRELGGVVRGTPALLQASLCKTGDGHLGLHLVLADGNRTVTVFILPRDAPRAPVPLRTEGMRGWLIGSHGVGFAVLADPPVDPDAYVALLDRSITWPQA